MNAKPTNEHEGNGELTDSKKMGKGKGGNGDGETEAKTWARDGEFIGVGLAG